MKHCLEVCRKNMISCPVKDCRFWINFKEDLNCSFESIEKNDSMTLREVAERLGISYVRVKQIQDVALGKIVGLF